MSPSKEIKTLDQFNREYLAVHTSKEDFFWTTYMAMEKDEHALQNAENAYKSYISDPQRLTEVRAALPQAKDPREKTALLGWLNFFEANAIENPEAQRLQKKLIELEQQIYQKRSKHKLQYISPTGETKDGSSVVLATNIAASEDERTRKSSHEGLLGLEQWVLTNGFIELVKTRNEFARAQGFKSYFDYRVFKNERMTHDELFAILKEFEEMTRESCRKHLDSVAKEKGTEAILGHNLKYAVAGSAEKKLNPYLPFKNSLEAWCKSFARLGIEYRGATLTLDLFDRKGKYENGFMHGPQPCFYDHERWIPARINFTSNATPNLIGSGKKGLGTLFHEGGHAAHFANITMNSPCFSMEYPPTSMAYAETQSMFCDSLIEDGDWLKLYAQNTAGETIPDEVIRLLLTSDHPFKAFQERSILVVPFFEDRLYRMPESELNSEAITRLARQCEQEILLIDCSPRPLLSIPHLLGAESACSYQGYLLAHMAVYQTRSHFLKKYGYLADNPKIGPDLAQHYWAPGNSLSHKETVKNLTGKTLSGRELAEYCNQDNDELWAETQSKIDSALVRGATPTTGDLNAKIRIVHGAEQIANNEETMEGMWRHFAEWVTSHYPE
ncbi:MAG: peptidase M3 [Bdellovibrionales bacterium GWC1_52_8]|nr:MAG: peptidase M3 [Bdellovibrionales bacterium GWB1_52_6]OFZ05427.1 MAG: peptidase M3 [Bdellovibrionales bacterium GWA1_52_35]OFZ41449.1 MAG: peptidase M3 [Bdellovibrionales bacterium GWC1_52_8]HCM39211.1 peptidase M3 [Bdellovibrionales bacterium]